MVKTGEAYIYAGGNPILFSDPSGLYRNCADPDDPCHPSNTFTTNHGSKPNGEDRLPVWVPVVVRDRVNSNPGLKEEPKFLDDVLRGDLDDFREMWENPNDDPGWDFTNDGCSDRGFATAGHFGCIRHDFLYRNQRRIDTMRELGGDLRENNHEFKALVDRTLRSDIGGGRGLVTYLGVWAAGDGFHDEWVKENWEQATDFGASPYGDNPTVFSPTQSHVDFSSWFFSDFVDLDSYLPDPSDWADPRRFGP